MKVRQATIDGPFFPPATLQYGQKTAAQDCGRRLALRKMRLGEGVGLSHGSSSDIFFVLDLGSKG